MKKFVSYISLVLTALLCLCCCTDNVLQANESSEAIELSIIEEFIVSAELNISKGSTDHSTSEESLLSNMEHSSEVSSEGTSKEIQEESFSAVDITSQHDDSNAESKPEEMIPDLILGPKPEGAYHVLYVGESLQLYSQIEGSELEDAMLKWTVDGKGIISFSAKRVTALKPGEASVTLSYSNGLKAVTLKFLVLEQESSSSEVS